MKKLFKLSVVLVAVLLLATTNAVSQINADYFSRNKIVGMYIGIKSTNLDMLKSSSNGLSIGFDAGFLHLGISSNYASGDGEYLDFESSSSYSLDKRRWILYDIGINIAITKNLHITPKVGSMIIDNIYNDPILWDTWFTKRYDSKIFKGIDLVYLDKSNLYVITGISFTGTGNKEIIYNMGIGYNFWGVN